MRTIRFPIFVIKQDERGIVERFGQYVDFVGPGLHFQWPMANVTRVRDIREHTMDIRPQPVITKDNVEITVDGVLWVRPGLTSEEIQKTFYGIDDWKVAVLQMAMTNLRQEFGALTLDESHRHAPGPYRRHQGALGACRRRSRISASGSSGKPRRSPA